jgi:hypothetical protein
MTEKDAYLQGVKNSERTIKDVFEKIVRNEDDGIPFPDPHMETIRQIIKERCEYYYALSKRNNNIGMNFRKKVKIQLESLDLFKR